MPLEVNKDRTVNIWRINVPQVVATFIAAIGTVASVVWIIGGIKTEVSLNRSANEEQDRNFAERRSYVDAQITILNSQLKDLATVPYRVTVNEAKIDATNQRVDKIQSNMNASVESIKDAVGALATKVEVQSNKIDTLSKKVDGLNNPGSAFRMRAEN
jgi:hypothetical protein